MEQRKEILFRPHTNEGGFTEFEVVKEEEDWTPEVLGEAWFYDEEWVVTVADGVTLCDWDFGEIGRLLKDLNTTICDNCGTGVHAMEVSCIGCGQKRGETYYDE